MNKTLAFHTSTTYEISAPEPYTLVSHEDIVADLNRISQEQYASDFDLHMDLSQSFKRVNDGHLAYINNCYDGVSHYPERLALL